MTSDEPTGFRSCAVCSAPLEPDAVCLACAFDGALAGEDEVGEMEHQSSFGKFAPKAAGDFGKYQLTKELGSGGMGVIWEAEDTSLKRTVAIKMIRGFAFSSSSEQQRFQREATAVAQLEHPNIVPVYEVGEVEGQPYFTMKRFTGGTLSEKMASGPMDQREAAQIMEKLARAIAHAHERGVLHRDLKPDNVLLDSSGEPHLTDFGLAKLLDEVDGLTLTTAHVGTPHYMSPEQARGRAKDITAASDVWAAGALFYHMLTGALPFPGGSSAEIFDRSANHDPVPMSKPPEKVDRALEILCLQCLQKEPAHRPPSAKMLADELSRWLAGEPIQTIAHRQSSEHSRIRRHPWWAAGAALAGLAVAAFIFSQRPSSLDETRSDKAAQSLAREETTVYLEATERLVDSGIWVMPGDRVKITAKGGYTYRDNPKIWTMSGHESVNASQQFPFPVISPLALVGTVHFKKGESVSFKVADGMEYTGEFSGALSYVLNTPKGEAGSSGGFEIHSVVERKHPMVIGSDPHKVASVPEKFRLETFSVDGDRKGPGFFIGYLSEAKGHGILPEIWDKDSARGSYIFEIEREYENGDSGRIALKVSNYHDAMPGKSYYLPKLQETPVYYEVSAPQWNSEDQPENNGNFRSLKGDTGYLRHSGYRLHVHPRFTWASTTNGQRIFMQDSSWNFHEIQ